MGNDIMRQLWQAAISVAVGGAAGLVYDALAALRRGRGLVFAFLLDSIFCFALGAGLFAIGYGPGEGELRLFMLACLTFGLVLYFAVLGGKNRRLFGFCITGIGKAAAFAGKPLKKLEKNAKKLFQKLKKWYTLYHKTIVPDESAGKEREKRCETEKSGPVNQDCSFGDSDIYGAVSYRYAWPHNGSACGERPACSAGEESFGGKCSCRIRNSAQRR